MQPTDTQDKKIRMNINLLCFEGTSEKLQRILRSHKIISAFFTGSTLHKLLCKPKDGVTTEGKSNIVCEIGCSNCKTVQLGESKWSLTLRSAFAFWSIPKTSARNCDCEKNEIAKHCWEADHNFSWDQKEVVDRKSMLIPTKIKGTIHSLKNPNHISKVSNMFAEIRLPYLRQFLNTYLCYIHNFIQSHCTTLPTTHSHPGSQVLLFPSMSAYFL